MAKKIEELPIHSRVEEFWNAINAILDRPAVRKDCDLHDELSRARRTARENAGRFIEYLRKCDWKDRGSHATTVERKAKRRADPPSEDSRSEDSEFKDSGIQGSRTQGSRTQGFPDSRIP